MPDQDDLSMLVTRANISEALAFSYGENDSIKVETPRQTWGEYWAEQAVIDWRAVEMYKRTLSFCPWILNRYPRTKR